MQFLAQHIPPPDGISRNINPRELMTGTKIDYNRHIHAEFGEYVQVVHKEHDNSMNTRTTSVIATEMTGNAQGGHWFYSLPTGRMLDRMGTILLRILQLKKRIKVSRTPTTTKQSMTISMKPTMTTKGVMRMMRLTTSSSSHLLPSRI